MSVEVFLRLAHGTKHPGFHATSWVIWWFTVGTKRSFQLQSRPRHLSDLTCNSSLTKVSLLLASGTYGPVHTFWIRFPKADAFVHHHNKIRGRTSTSSLVVYGCISMVESGLQTESRWWDSKLQFGRQQTLLIMLSNSHLCPLMTSPASISGRCFYWHDWFYHSKIGKTVPPGKNRCRRMVSTWFWNNLRQRDDKTSKWPATEQLIVDTLRVNEITKSLVWKINMVRKCPDPKNVPSVYGNAVNY